MSILKFQMAFRLTTIEKYWYDEDNPSKKDFTSNRSNRIW